VIGVSKAITDGLEHDFAVPADKLRRIPNGVEINGPFRPRNLVRPSVVGLVARLQPEKDVPTFLRCAARLASRLPGVTFRIAGDGPLRRELEGLARELGIGARVRFLGVVKEMETFYEEIDVLASSSLSEGTPLAIAEAMGAGIPVVATAVGGIPDQIEDGREGLLVEPGDAHALAARIEWLVKSQFDTRRIAQAAYRRAAREFSLEAMASKTDAVYQEVVAGPERPVSDRRPIEATPATERA